MRPRLLLLAAVAVPSVAAAAFAAHGCNSSPSFDSACLWIADQDNCYREFLEDMTVNAGQSIDNPTGTCKPPGNPTEANQSASSPAGTPNGHFGSRDKLDVCVLDSGGQVTVDPPIDLTMWPPSLYADPVTYTFTFAAPDGNTCGKATYTSPHGFTLTINPPPDAGGGAGGMSTTTTNTLLTDTSDKDAAVGEMRYPSGTFSSVIPPGSDAFDVTCPSGETHHFNLNELTGAPGGEPGSCPGIANLMSSASFQVYPGGVNLGGAVSFAINFPPITGTLPNPKGMPTANPPTVYFNCSVPSMPVDCADGMKDNAETDVDCGGPSMGAGGDGGTCPARCADMQKCLVNSDCLPGHVCQTSAMTGMKTCGCIPLTACPGGSDCGMMSDGCGGTLMCGPMMCATGTCGGGGTPNQCGCCSPPGMACVTCTAPETCGGGGTPGKCGCTPLTACPAGDNCGTMSNGCGSTITCLPNNCVAPQTCGGAGNPNACGCTPMTMCPAGQDCGTAPDGCGGMIDCGTCSAPKTCGGGGTLNQCGCCGLAGCGTCTAPETCGGGGTPNACGCMTGMTTCPPALNCGTLDNGCGKALTCGTAPCKPPQTCGGGGTPNVCGCTPTVTSCPSGANCGTVDNGCGGPIHCGPPCDGGTCGGGGIPNQCGTCTPSMTCTNGHNCGMGPDGCGNMISCGMCPSFQTCGGGGTPGFCG